MPAGQTLRWLDKQTTSALEGRRVIDEERQLERLRSDHEIVFEKEPDLCASPWTHAHVGEEPEKSTLSLCTHVVKIGRRLVV